MSAALHDVLVYVFAFERPDGAWGAVNDNHERLIVTLRDDLVGEFISALNVRTTLPVLPVRQKPDRGGAARHERARRRQRGLSAWRVGALLRGDRADAHG